MARKAKQGPNPNREGFYRWVVEVEVHKTWVEDGFDLNDEEVHDRLRTLLPYAYGHEIKARVLDRPRRSAIRKEQGYKK